jgi:hypothetical protein
MKAYKIWCEWEMPIAQGVFSTKEKAQKAINNEDWESYTDYTLEEVQKEGLVQITEIEIQ